MNQIKFWTKTPFDFSWANILLKYFFIQQNCLNKIFWQNSSFHQVIFFQFFCDENYLGPIFLRIFFSWLFGPNFSVTKIFLDSQHLSTSGISQLSLTQFWPDFESRFLRPSLTDSNRHGVICHRTICPSQLFVTQFWPSYRPNFFCCLNLWSTKLVLLGPIFF